MIKKPRICLISLLLFFAFNAVSEVRLKIISGELSSQYNIQSNGTVKFTNSKGLDRTIKIIDGDLKALMNEAKSLQQLPSDRGPCPRNSMEVTIPEGKKMKSILACQTTSTPTAYKIKQFVQLVDLVTFKTDPP